MCIVTDLNEYGWAAYYGIAAMPAPAARDALMADWREKRQMIAPLPKVKAPQAAERQADD